MSSRKRRRNSPALRCVFFPDDVHTSVRREMPALASSSRSWERCGESFQDTALMKNLKNSGRKLSAARNLAEFSSSAQTSCSEVQISWSSSGSDQSDGEAERAAASSLSSCRASLLTAAHTADLPDIDSDSEEDVSQDERKSEPQISDCDSQSDGGKPATSLRTSQVDELEISGYSSDGEGIGGSLNSSRLDPQVGPPLSSEAGTRSLSCWVRSAQAMLQTPQKQTNRQPKTPEDSASKKRKFQRGGLAHRLRVLQSRRRSAVSFWKYRSDQSETATPSVDRPGVLLLEVVQVHSECSMQLALCEHHQGPPTPPSEDPRDCDSVPEDRGRVLVLFDRETSSQLRPEPTDIIHIYPPWQSLSVEGFSCPVILNTHFSLKVSSWSNAGVSGSRCVPYHLAHVFTQLEDNRTSDEARQASDARCSYSGGLNRPCVSLLEAIESLGQAGSVEQEVEVVVQRVYCIPVSHSPPASVLKSRVRSRRLPAPEEESSEARLCVLVQDNYGTFSVVQLHLLPHIDHLPHNCLRWQGKSCTLRGIKVLRRLTRERTDHLFSLIDSLWPPATPLRHHGNSLKAPTESLAAGPPPSFCYLLSGRHSSVHLSEAPTTSPLYIQPSEKSLRDILQSDKKVFRCSFTATVLYKRVQGQDTGRQELWLVLTDRSLQEDRPNQSEPRSLPLGIKPSCVVTASVLKALSSSTACCLAFRDALREQGVLLCVEQSVVEVCSQQQDAVVLSSVTEALSPPSLHPKAVLPLRPDTEASLPLRSETKASLPLRPVRLDPLSLETTPGCLCSVSGVIVGVDEDSAFSWPVCSQCASDDLQTSSKTPQTFLCVSCNSRIDEPDLKIQLEVFLSCSAVPDCTVKVKLQQKTILSVLNLPLLRSSEFSGVDVESVLGKEVGPLSVYVRVSTRSPALRFGLEEVCL